MKTYIKYYSHLILQTQLKWLVSILIFLTIHFIFNFNYIENMGNCMNTPAASADMLDSRYYLSQQGIQAENRALNTIITDLRQEILDLKHQIILNNQLSEEQNSLIHQLTAEQKETKTFLIELKQERLVNKEKNNVIQEENYRCMR